MKNNLKFFRLNKKNNQKSFNNTITRHNIVSLLLISLLIISAPVTLFSTSTVAQHIESEYETILNGLGFTNIALSTLETFPAGKYQATLYAELAGYAEINVLSYYPTLTDNYQTIFTGPEGAPYGSDGYITPPYPTKTFEVENEFGLSLLASFRFFTEHWRNTDYPEQHSKIYENLNSPNMYLIGFEDQLGGDDRDYNDMIFSLTQIISPKIVSITRTPENPTPNQEATITAKVIEGEAEIESVILSYQTGSSSWTNQTMNLNDETYSANIPGQPVNTQVNYKIYAIDTEDNSDTSPIESYVVTIPASSPIAVLTYSPTVAYTNEIIQFDASNSYDPDGTIVSYSWNFGDQNTATGPTVSHSYEKNGEYQITLTITDNENLVGGKTATQIIKNRRPIAAISVTEPIQENKSTLFDATQSYDSDGTIISYTWSFGDGTAASGTTATHSFTDAGVYSVTLAVEDNDGATDEQKLTIFVTQEISEETNRRPVASFTATPKIASIGETVNFDASQSSDSDGTITTYSWNFGDNNTATGVTSNHAYTEQGTYTIILTVTDNNGKIDIDSQAVSVTTKATPNINPVASFNKTTQTTSRGENIHFDATESYDTDGLVVSYIWDFGDGNTATGTEVDHIYETVGVYTVTLTITDSDGVTTKTTSAITITNAIPVATFTKSAETIKVGETVVFDASQSSDSDGTITTYSWNFGDGNTTTGITTENTYNEQGTYTVTLTITDNNGDSSSFTANITVETEATSLDLISIVGIAITAMIALILIAILAKRRISK